jgi:LPXTG-motif cell wall-anchored protein
MEKLNKKVTLIVLAGFLVIGFAGLVMAATTVNLGTADDFAILAGSTITNTGPSVINGDVGLTPGNSVTGFPPGTISGIQYIGNATAIQAQNDLVTAYNDAAGKPCTQNLSGQDLGGLTLTPGVYCFDTSAQLTGTLTLNAQNDSSSVFIFRIGSTLTTAGASKVIFTNDTQACNVFWQVGSSATLGTNTSFEGNILALTSITLNTGANVEGRVLARNGAVTLDTNTITKATCASTVPSVYISNDNTITVIKQVINDNGGTANFLDFPLFINGKTTNSGQSVPLAAGIYTITENSFPGYTRTFTGNCDVNGQINHGGVNTHNDVCTVVNDDIGAPAIAPVPPLIDVVKVPDPLALPGGPGSVTYTYTTRNIGTVPMTDVTLVGDTCSPIVLVSGDTNNDSKLDVSETWVYRCTKIISETTKNTVVATGHANGLNAVDVANATVVVGLPIVPPLIHVTKVPSPLTLLSGAGTITYTKKVTNPGTVALSNITITDDKCAPVNYISGDVNGDSKLDTTETWTYTCISNLTKTTTNTVTVTGEANGLKATDFAVSTVVVAVPKLPKTGSTNLWNILMLLGAVALVSLAVIFKKRTA